MGKSLNQHKKVKYMETINLGKDASNQDIIPIKSKLVVKTNRHPNCDGTRWGWIEGCSKNIVWSNENSKFNKEKADELVLQYNSRNYKSAHR